MELEMDLVSLSLSPENETDDTATVLLSALHPHVDMTMRIDEIVLEGVLEADPPFHTTLAEMPDARRHLNGGGMKVTMDALVGASGLMTYKQFVLQLADNILPPESAVKYEEYRRDEAKSARERYFTENKQKEFLIEKFHPKTFEESVTRRKVRVAELAQQFVAALQAGSLDVNSDAACEFWICGRLLLIVGAEDAGDADGEAMSEDEEEGPNKRRGKDGSKRRSAASAYPAPAPAYASIRTRVKHDLHQSRELILQLDKEKSLENISEVVALKEEEATGDAATTAEPEAKILEQLDLQLCYLWRVHRVNYYAGEEGKTEAFFLEDYGKRSGRAPTVGKPSTEASAEPAKEADLQEDSEGLSWASKVDDAWSSRKSQGDPLLKLTWSTEMAQNEEEWLTSCVRKIDEGKYGCNEPGCQKRFWGPEFVKKHAKLKHVQSFEEHHQK
eukprot:gene2488-3232_t